MGFQSSFNQMLATASVMTGGAKHLKQQATANKQQETANRIAAGNEYQTQYNMAKDLASETTGHMNQLNAVLRGGEALNQKAKAGQMTRKAYEKAFQAQLEQGSMIYDQNQDLIARRNILQNRIDATREDIIKAGFGGSPMPKSKLELMDMRKDPKAHLTKLDESDAKWKTVGRPKKGGNK